MSNSLRDEVEDAIKEILGDRPFMDVDDVACQIADAVFGVMGIPENDQDLSADAARYLLKIGLRREP